MDTSKGDSAAECSAQLLAAQLQYNELLPKVGSEWEDWREKSEKGLISGHAV